VASRSASRDRVWDPSRPEPLSFESRSSPVRTILLLAANPRETASLRLGEEFKRIEEVRRLSSKRDGFRLVKLEATSDEDLRSALLEERPEIVHFSGHGIGQQGVASARDLVVADDSGQGGLAFEDEMGHLLKVRGDSLGRLLKHFSDDVKCVVLNACFSNDHAEAIAQHIDYVIGMNRAIGDKAAITFAVGFYGAIVAGRSVECAFDLGCNAIDLKGIPEHQTPVLKKKSSTPVRSITTIVPAEQTKPSAPQAGMSLPRSAAPASPLLQPVIPKLDRRSVKKAGDALADYIGQVAHFIAEKQSACARNPGHLYELLAREIDDPTQREEFLRTKPR
jgi:hypothetical protein